MTLFSSPKSFVLLSLIAIVALPCLAGLDGGDWNDGRAEVAVYESEIMVGGAPAAFRELISVRREDIRTDSLVRVDKRPKDADVRRVYEMNVSRHVETKGIPSSVNATVFVRADDPASVMKMSVGSADLAGNVFKLLTNPSGQAGTLLIHSYRDGEADKAGPLELQEGDYFDDALPLSLRALKFKPGLDVKGRLWDGLADDRGSRPSAVPVTIRVLEEDVLRTHAGSFTCWKVSVEREGAAPDTYWFEKAAPHILVRMAKSDGATRQLYARARWAYWDRRFPRPNILN